MELAPQKDVQPPRTALVTVVHGQHQELMAQVGGIAVGSRVPDLHVVIGMADPDVSRGRLPVTSDRWRTITRAAQTTDPARLPFATARNLGAATAIEQGAQVLVFLSVRCIPGARLVERYAEHARSVGRTRSAGDARCPVHPAPVLWCGELRNLPPAPPVIGYPVYRLESQCLDLDPLLPVDHVEVDHPARAFTGESFAITAGDFRATGGFCPKFRGAEGVDEDFAHVVSTADGTVVRIGGAPAYRQFRPAALPAAEDVRRLVGNANLFADRWGRATPIEELEHLAATGLARHDEERDRWVVV